MSHPNPDQRGRPGGVGEVKDTRVVQNELGPLLEKKNKEVKTCTGKPMKKMQREGTRACGGQ